mmetsp:Transcript_11706/g.27092  ORF Transcript_11706/g.27092 Transcript_11706/m.27092 type:complete len:200 (+) Transcript_11706:69-668(+)
MKPSNPIVSSRSYTIISIMDLPSFLQSWASIHRFGLGLPVYYFSIMGIPSFPFRAFHPFSKIMILYPFSNHDSLSLIRSIIIMMQIPSQVFHIIIIVILLHIFFSSICQFIISSFQIVILTGTSSTTTTAPSCSWCLYFLGPAKVNLEITIIDFLPNPLDTRIDSSRDSSSNGWFFRCGVVIIIGQSKGFDDIVIFLLH